MSAENVIKLQYSIPVTTEKGTAECTELTISRFKAKHLKLLPKNLDAIKPVEMIPVIAGLVGITAEEAGEIDMSDLLIISKLVTSFLDASPEETGESFSG